MKKAYTKPQVTEYGPASQLTLGWGGQSPDQIMLFDIQIASNNNGSPGNAGSYGPFTVVTS